MYCQRFMTHGVGRALEENVQSAELCRLAFIQLLWNNNETIVSGTLELKCSGFGPHLSAPRLDLAKSFTTVHINKHFEKATETETVWFILFSFYIYYIDNFEIVTRRLLAQATSLPGS